MLTVAEALNRAVEHHQRGQLQAAEQLYRQILQVNPSHADALHLLGVISSQTGRHDQALQYLSHAITLQPNNPVFLGNLGMVHLQMGKPAEAIGCYERSIRLKSDFDDAHRNLAVALAEQARWQEAEASCRQALRLRPDSAESHNVLGIVLKCQHRLDESVAAYRQALRLSPNLAGAYNNLANALMVQGKFDEAVTNFQEAIRLNPNYQEAHNNLAMAWLLMGNYPQGWPEYEWRWKRPDLVPPPYPHPRWDGFSLAGKTIMLYAEQGLGDVLQFVRYVPLVKQRGATVLVSCQKVLARLVARCPDIERVYINGDPLPNFDVQAALLSLPAVFGTTVENIPANVPYLFPDQVLVEQWQRELACYRGLKVGIVWQGNPKHKDDRHRSFPLALFEPLARMEGVQLFSLQKGAGSEQLPGLAGRWAVTDLVGKLEGDFMETAAIVKNLDLVITVDTAPAHLAGALGVPVWVALQYHPDWRWLLKREDNPWYPSLRLFRQTEPGNWGGVFERIGEALKGLVATRAAKVNEA